MAPADSVSGEVHVLHGCLFTVTSHGGRGKGVLWPLVRVLIPFCGGMCPLS